MLLEHKMTADVTVIFVNGFHYFVLSKMAVVLFLNGNKYEFLMFLCNIQVDHNWKQFVGNHMCMLMTLSGS